MNIYIIPTGPFLTNCYILAVDSLNCVIIDPGVGSKELVIKKVENLGLHPKAIWLTHTHWDHIAGVKELKELYQISVWVHFEDRMNLISPGSDGVPFKGSIPPCEPDHYLDEGLKLALDDLEFSVIHTPGHTPGGCCFYCESEGILLSGDTLFKRSIGTLDLPTSQADRMWTSLAKLAKLPANTKFYPGHGPSSTIGDTPWLDRAEEMFS